MAKIQPYDTVSTIELLGFSVLHYCLGDVVFYRPLFFVLTPAVCVHVFLASANVVMLESKT